jgi:hypothetical protein
MVITFFYFFLTFKEVVHLYNIIQEDKHFFNLENIHIMEQYYDEQGKIVCLVNVLSDLHIFNHVFAFFTLLSYHIKNQFFCAELTLLNRIVLYRVFYL